MPRSYEENNGTVRDDTNARTLYAMLDSKSIAISSESVTLISNVLLGAGLNGALLGLIFALIFFIINMVSILEL
jgi:hypothetical protein